MTERKRLPKGIRKKQEGVYEWRFTFEGKPYGGYEKTQTAAYKALNERRYEVEHGRYTKETKLTVNDWFKTWLITYKTGDSRLYTVRTYKSIYSHHIAPEIGARRLKMVRAEHLQYILKKTAENKSRATLDLVKTILSGMFKQAYKNMLIVDNPYLRTTAPKGKASTRKGAVSKELQAQFLKYAAKSPYSNVFKLAAQTGARVGELLALQWEDVDSAAQRLQIRHTLIWTKESGFALGDPKTREGMRDIPLTPAAAACLKDEHRRQLERRLKAGDNWAPKEGLENLVFTTTSGAPIAPQWIDRSTKRIKDKMAKDGVEMPPGFSFHSLRHCFATRAIENGMNMKSLQKIMGHATLAMTMDRYADALPDTLAAEMEKVAAGL